MTSAIAAAASSLVRSSWRVSFSISAGNMAQSSRPLEEVAQDPPALAGQDRLGMKLHAVDRPASRCRRPMIVPSSRVRAVTSSSAGSPSLGDDQRVIARGDERPGDAGEHAAAVVLDRRRLAVHRRRARARPSRRTPRRSPDAPGTRRESASSARAARITSIVTPASSGRPGPGEMTMRSGLRAATSLDA